MYIIDVSAKIKKLRVFLLIKNKILHNINHGGLLK